MIAAAVRDAAEDVAPWAEREALVVTLGGADPGGLTEAVTASVERGLADRLATGRRHVVLGPCFRGASGRASALRDRGWQVHHALSREAWIHLVGRARGVVCGFGTSVYELAFLATPVVYVAHRADDAPAAQRLQARGLGALVGVGGALTPRALAHRLSETLARPEWCAETTLQGRSLLGDGHGAARVLDAILSAALPAQEHAPAAAETA